MNEHRTEQQLIDYAFDLASDAAKRQARAHLDQCDACRRKLDVLKGKFAALDLLADEIQASPDLLAQTVATATGPRPVRRLPIWRHTWIGAVAAVIVVGISLLMVSTLQPGRAPQTPAGEPVVVDSAKASEMKSESLAPAPTKRIALAEKDVAVQTLAPTAPAPMASLAMAPLRKPTEEIVEKPPFAPASAIELVVLPRREDIQLTIYNGADLTLVRERRHLTLKKGWNWLQFMWAGTLIDPTSLTLEPVTHQDRVEVQQLVFPPRLRELGRWLIRSETSGQVPFELTYLTSGLSWRAFYMGTLSQDELTMDLQGYVRVDNQSGEEYENAQTRLIVGEVHLLDQIRELAQRQYAYGSPLPDGVKGMGMMGGMGGRARVKFVDLAFRGAKDDRMGLLGDILERKEIRKEGLSEYFLYTIEGAETIPNEWGKRLLSFEVEDIPVTSLYKYDEQRWGSDPMRFVTFANDTEHELGESPLPNGQVRIYGRADAERHLSYVGGTGVKYIPVGEEVELNLGPARLVKVEPTLMDFATDHYVFDSNDNVTGWDEVRTWKVEIANARALPVDIEVTRGFETAYWELELRGDGVAYEKHDATHARFKLTVAPRHKQAFTYIVTTCHGVREEAFVRKQR